LEATKPSKFQSHGCKIAKTLDPLEALSQTVATFHESVYLFVDVKCHPKKDEDSWKGTTYLEIHYRDILQKFQKILISSSVLEGLDWMLIT
jgi:hypothetical protein